MAFEPETLTTQQLLHYFGQILEELRTRKISRTSNIPTGDYAEFLIANQLGLVLETNSKAGYDAKDSLGVKFQIKGRRLTKRNKSRQLGLIRNLKNQDFDYLIAILFNEQFEIELVVKIPHELIGKYARYSQHTNAHILRLGDHILRNPMVEDLTPQFRS
jgi:hypothetical protein